MTQQVQQLPVADFSVEQIPLGSKQRLHLVVERLADGNPVIFPTLVVRGTKPGPIFLVNGATHGDEYEGIISIPDVFEELDPNTMSGTFVGIPVLNGPAFTAATRESGIDHLNLARIFPGDPNGSISMRIAHAFKTYLLPQADLYLDIHSGGNNYAMYPFSGYGVTTEENTKRQLEAATAFGLEVIWASLLLPGRTLTSAAELGVPAIYVELRGEGRCIARDRALTVQGIRNVMAYMGIIEGDYPTKIGVYAETIGEHDSHLQADHPSPTSGVFVPDVELWQYVEAGQRLGVIRHPDGSVIAEVPVSRTGRVLFLRTFPRVYSGDCLAYVLALPEAAV